MSEKSRRLFDKFVKQQTKNNNHDWTFFDFGEFVLDEIRARRNRMRKEPDTLGGPPWQYQFARLFDDGAEFGPDKPEPEFMFVDSMPEEIQVWKNGRITGIALERDLFDAIKKIGADEAAKQSYEAVRDEGGA